MEKNVKIHKAIISEEAFALAQDTFQRHKKREKKTIDERHLKGIVRCKACGHLMERKKNIFYCGYKNFQSFLSCKESSITEEKIRDILLLVIDQYSCLVKDDNIRSSELSIKEKEDKAKNEERQIRKWKSTAFANYEDYKMERISFEEYLKRKSKINNIIEKLKEETKQSKNANEKNDVEDESEEKEKIEIIEGIVSEIWVYSSNRIEIAFLT